jgi:riboflavin kinase/FMN adenylyltransferase
VTFDPHPVEVLAPGTDPRLITDLHERVALFASLGIELVAVVDLHEVRYLDPAVFVDEILVGKLRLRSMVTGADFQFGKDRAGNVALIEAMAPASGFEVEVVELVASDGVISSSRVRALIEVGRVADAASLLGSRYRLTAEVVHGDSRGREIGFPTANLVPPARKVVPAHGVYAAFARIEGGEPWPAAVNIGVRPTFGGGPRLVEAFLLDFDDDIYGSDLTIEFVERLRDELRFETVEALLAQMAGDVEATRERLGRADSNVS